MTQVIKSRYFPFMCQFTLSLSISLKNNTMLIIKILSLVVKISCNVCILGFDLKRSDYVSLSVLYLLHLNKILNSFSTKTPSHISHRLFLTTFHLKRLLFIGKLCVRNRVKTLLLLYV